MQATDFWILSLVCAFLLAALYFLARAAGTLREWWWYVRQHEPERWRDLEYIHHQFLRYLGRRRPDVLWSKLPTSEPNDLTETSATEYAER